MRIESLPIESKNSRDRDEERLVGGDKRSQGFQVSLMLPDTISPSFRNTIATPNAKYSNRFAKDDEGRDDFWLEDTWEGLEKEVEDKQP